MPRKTAELPPTAEQKTALIEEARTAFYEGGEVTKILYGDVIQKLTLAGAGFKALDMTGLATEEAMRGQFMQAVAESIAAKKLSPHAFDVFVRENQHNTLVREAFPVLVIEERELTA